MEASMREQPGISNGGKPAVPNDDFHKVDDPEFSKDLIVRAESLSVWLFGTPNKARSIFHLVETSRLPTFRIGSQIAARKSILRAFFWSQERRAFQDHKDEDLVRLGALLPRLGELIRAAYDAPTAPRDMQVWRLLLVETVRTIDRILKSEQGTGR
jgi:hypothetical protein